MLEQSDRIRQIDGGVLVHIRTDEDLRRRRDHPQHQVGQSDVVDQDRVLCGQVDQQERATESILEDVLPSDSQQRRVPLDENWIGSVELEPDDKHHLEWIRGHDATEPRIVAIDDRTVEGRWRRSWRSVQILTGDVTIGGTLGHAGEQVVTESTGGADLEIDLELLGHKRTSKQRQQQRHEDALKALLLCNWSPDVAGHRYTSAQYIHDTQIPNPMVEVPPHRKIGHKCLTTRY